MKKILMLLLLLVNLQITEDGILNIFDLCMMKRKFIRDATNLEVPVLLVDGN